MYLLVIYLFMEEEVNNQMIFLVISIISILKHLYGNIINFIIIRTKPEIHGTIPIPRCYCAADTLGNGNELWIIGGHKGNMIFN